MNNLTAFEYIVMNQIAHHEMNSINGATPTCADDVNTYCWPEAFTRGEELTVNQVKGVLSSLVQKEYIVIEDYDEDHKTVCFTENGFTEWKKEYDIKWSWAMFTVPISMI